MISSDFNRTLHIYSDKTVGVLSNSTLKTVASFCNYFDTAVCLVLPLRLLSRESMSYITSAIYIRTRISRSLTAACV